MTEQLQEAHLGGPATIGRNMTDYSDEALLNRYASHLDQKESIASELGRIEQEMHRRMNERQATAIHSEEFICGKETKDSYSQPAFTPLKEIFYTEDLESCLIWAHEETVQVPDRWETTKVKALAKRYGKEALDIVERARIPGAPRLRLRRREQAD